MGMEVYKPLKFEK